MLSAWWEGVRRGLQAGAHRRRADHLYRRSEFAAAIVEYQEAVRLRPDEPIPYFNLGIALYKSGRKSEARAAWNKALALTENSRPYLAEQARILLRQFG